MPSVKLSSQNLKSRSGYSLVSPTTGIQSSDGINALKSGAIDPNAAASYYAPRAVPSIVVDTTITSGAKMADVWAQAAFKFQQRKEEADAIAAVVLATEQYNRALYGTDEEEGYAAQKGGAAVAGFGDYQETLQGVSSDILSNLPQGVQAKASLKIKGMQESFNTRGAQHKVAQQTVYEKDLLTAQAASIRKSAVLASSSPRDFLVGLEQAKSEIALQLQGRPEAQVAAMQAFQTQLYEDVIKSHTASGQFELAQEYIDMGKIDEVDSIVLAERQAILNNQKESANDDKWTQYQRDRIRAANYREDEYRTLLNQAVNASDPTAISLITDTELRGKALKAWKDNFDTVTMNKDYMAMVNDPELEADPYKILDTTDSRVVSAQDRTALLARRLSERKAGVTNLARENKNWISGFFAKTTVGITGKYMDEHAETSSVMMQNKLDDAIMRATQKGENVREAVLAARMDILSKPEIYTDRYAALSYTPDTLVLPNDAEPFEAMDNIVRRVTYGSIEPYAAQQRLQTSLALTSFDVLDKYGVGDLAGKGLTAAEKNAELARRIPDPADREMMYRDLIEVQELNLFYRNEINSAAEASGSSGSISVSTKSAAAAE